MTGYGLDLYNACLYSDCSDCTDSVAVQFSCRRSNLLCISWLDLTGTVCVYDPDDLCRHLEEWFFPKILILWSALLSSICLDLACPDAGKSFPAEDGLEAGQT